MDTARPPLRVAFWAIAAALGLTLFLSLSDPHAVRQSILTRGDALPRPPAGQEHDSAGPVLVAGQLTPELPIARDKESESDPAESEPTLDLKAMSPPSPQEAGITRQLTPATTVSSQPESPMIVVRETAVDHGTSAMPILSPGMLQGVSRRGEVVELPPPPGTTTEDPEGTISRADTTPDVHFLDSADPFTAPGAGRHETEQLRLEAEVLILRSELARIADAQGADRVQRIQDRQEDLIDQQRATADRLERLAERLTERTESIARLLEQTTPLLESVIDSDSSRDAMQPVVKLGVPQFEESADGLERFSLVIESDDVSAVLERLGRWSRDNTQNAPTFSILSAPETQPLSPYAASPLPSSLEAPARSMTAPNGYLTPPLHSRSDPPCDCR